MSINVSTSVLRNCVSDSLQAEIVFSKFQGVKRKNLIKALKGEKKMSDPTVKYIRDTYNLPRLDQYHWKGIAKDSGFWVLAEQAVAIAKLKGVDDAYKYRLYYMERYEAHLKEAEKLLAERPMEARVNSWYFKWMENKELQAWVEPVDPSNKVFELIAQLERGENPPFTMKFGQLHNYKPLEKRRK